MQIIVSDISELKSAAQSFIKMIGNNRSIAFFGDMGVGKTTFINAILDIMGIEDHSSSPTFSIVNEYSSIDYGMIYHFDFYRIEDENEALDIGIEDILYHDNYCFMEWPEKIENLLPENYVSVHITLDNNCRIIQIDL